MPINFFALAWPVAFAIILLAGVIMSGQLMAVFMAIAGGALDNAKKYVEDGHFGGKGSPAHKAGVEGDTVGDPLKDTAGPALNPMIKVVNLISLLKGQLPMLPAQTQLCWAHVDDVVQGHILAMEKGKSGGSYIIAGEPYKVSEAFKLASQIAGKRAPMVVPHQLVKVMSVLAGPFDALLPESYTSEGLRIVAGVTYLGDNGRAKKELGYSVRPFQEGWRATVQHEMSLLGMKKS